MSNEDEDIIRLIETCNIFSSIPHTVLVELFPKFKKITLEAGKVLFFRGEVSDCLYILLRGKLCAELTDAAGQEKIIGTITPVETIGELGIIANELRSLTVRATVDSELLQLSREIFAHLCSIYPSILRETIKPIIKRSVDTIKLIAGENKINVAFIFPANQEVSLKKFRQELAQYKSTQDKIVLLDTSQINFPQLETYFDKPQKEHPYRLIFVELSAIEKYQNFFNKVDTFYLLANGNGSIKFDALIEELFKKNLQHMQKKLELILLHAEQTLLPTNTSLWLKQIPFNFHYHVRQKNEKDYKRLLRFLGKRALGLVLGGGGAKGYMHVGVLKGLMEKNIPIDAIGGTSVGAIVAACFALSTNYADFLSQCQKIFSAAKKVLQLNNLIWPLISLFTASPATDVIQNEFKQICIEDLWLPFFCISSNITLRKQEVHRSGYLWQAIRASGSLPGLIPPMMIEGCMHVDGGSLNNLPVDVMQNLLGINSTIIASRISWQAREAKYIFPPQLRWRDVFLYKIGLKKYQYKFPSFLDTFLRALLLGAIYKEEENSRKATILINPDLSTFRTFETNKKIVEPLITIGYEEIIKALSQYNLN